MTQKWITTVLSTTLVIFSLTSYAEHRDLAPLPSDIPALINPQTTQDQFHTLREKVRSTLSATFEELAKLNAASASTSTLNTHQKSALQEQRDHLGELTDQLSSSLASQNLVVSESANTASTPTTLEVAFQQRIQQLQADLDTIATAKDQPSREKAITASQEKILRYLRTERDKKFKLPTQNGSWQYTPRSPLSPKVGAPEPIYQYHQSSIEQPFSSSVAFVKDGQVFPNGIQIASNGDTDALADILDGLEVAAYSPPATPVEVSSCYASSSDEATNKPLDLSFSPVELTLTDDIKKLAEQLKYSPVKILEWVTNNIQLEIYDHSVKGAQATLLSRAGNDMDQASLLVALLRASNIPARYTYGRINLENKPEHLNWMKFTSYTAMKAALVNTSWKMTDSAVVDQGQAAYASAHVWVMACVPYSNYRATGSDKTGHLWVPIDASFKNNVYKAGVTHTAQFDYAAYLSTRKKELPYEAFDETVLANVRAQDPNLTLKDVGGQWKQQQLKLEFLPDTLPYSVRDWIDWGSGIATAQQIPDNFRQKLTILIDANPVLSIPMVEVATKRVTLSFKGANTASQTVLDGWAAGTSVVSCPGSAGTTVIPEIKVNGVAKAYSPATFSLCSVDALKEFSLQMQVKDAYRHDNLITFGGLSPLRHYALQGYAFQASNAYLERRSAQLLANVKATPNPLTNRDAVVGDYLDLVLLKYLRYISDAGKHIGDVNQVSVRNGHHVGITMSGASVQYLLDLPYAIYTDNYVIDVPGAYMEPFHRATGNFDFETFKLAGYTASAYESYIWQENALTDAVSSVTGLQIANEGLGLELGAFGTNRVSSVTTSAALRSYVRQCTTIGSTVPHYPTAAETVTYLRDGGITDDSIHDYLTSTGWYTEPDILAALAQLFHTCYPKALIDALAAQLDLGLRKVTIPKEPLIYIDWYGSTYVLEYNNTSGSTGSASIDFKIDQYSGGYSTSRDRSCYTCGGSSAPYYPARATETNYNGSVSASTSDHGVKTDSSSYSLDSLINSAASGQHENDVPFYASSSSTGGYTSTDSFGGDPVNMANGNQVHSEVDFEIKAKGLPLKFERAYNSRAQLDSPLGYGWTHSFNQTLEFFDFDQAGKPTVIVWTDGSGAKRFIHLQNTEMLSGTLDLDAADAIIPEGFYFSLSRPYTSGTRPAFVLTEKSGTKFEFQNVAGTHAQVARLTKIIDRNNNTINLTYSGNNLQTVRDPDSRQISFVYYTGSPHIKTITLDWTGQKYEYKYDSNGNLSEYQSPLMLAGKANPTKYTYYVAADGPRRNHAMKTFTMGNGYSMTFEYYENGKVFRHFNAQGETMTFTYNEYLRESTTVDERGNLKQYFFNVHNLVEKIVEPDGGIHRYEYEHPTDWALRTSYINPMGHETQYLYDTAGNLTRETLPSTDYIEYSDFTSFGQPQKIRNANGDYVIHLYDATGHRTDEIFFKKGFGSSITPATLNPTTVSSQILAWTRFGYDSVGNPTLQRRVSDFTNANSGPYTTFGYTDVLNNLTGVNLTNKSYLGDTNGDGVITGSEGLGSYTSDYDAFGRVIMGQNAQLYPIEIYRDELGRIKRATDDKGQLRDYTQDAMGNLLLQSLTGMKDGFVTTVEQQTFKYDSANRLESSSNSVGATTYYDYDAMGNLLKVTNPDGYIVNMAYDEMGRMTDQWNEEGQTATLRYDLLGRVKEKTDANGNTTKNVYYSASKNGLLKESYDGLNRKTTFDYDALGRVTKVTDNAGRIKYMSYDPLGRLVRFVDHDYSDSMYGTVRPVTTYEYDNLGRQTKVYAGYTFSATDTTLDQLSLQETRTYDHFDRPLTVTNALNKVWRYEEYDTHNNPTKYRKPNNQLITNDYFYGGLVKSSSTSGPLGSSFRVYEYNALGQPVSVSTPDVAYEYDYDDANRLESVSDSRSSKSISYDYSHGGWLNSIHDSDGNTSEYQYDAVGRLSGIRGPKNALISYLYDAGGRLTDKVFPNGFTSHYEYNNDDSVKSLVTYETASQVALSQYTLTYNNVGQVDSRIQSNNGIAIRQKFMYDGLDRLQQIRDYDNNSLLQEISYDPFGNRRKHSFASGEPHFYLTNALHQIASVRKTSLGGPVHMSFVYDANGNMTQKVHDGLTLNMTYDGWDQLSTAAKTGLSTETYLYDQQGRRISKQLAGNNRVNYLYSGKDIIGEFSNDGTRLSHYTHGPGADDPLILTLNDQSYFYHGDEQGSITNFTNNAGELVTTRNYDAFGNTVATSANSLPLYGFTGREPDKTGLIYSRARYYDPTIGRFTQLDPMGFVDGVNRYAYGLNNPVNYVDPWGMSASSRTDTSYSTYLDMGASAFVPYYDASKAASSGNYGEAAVTAIIDTAAIIFAPESGGSSMVGGAALKGSLYGLKHADEIVSFAGRGASKQGTTVLGHYPEYTNLAESLGANRFNIPGRIWEGMSDPQRWAANQKFLDRMISRGDDIVLATPLDKVRPGSYFEQELEYLAEKGYQLSSDGSRLIKGK